MEDQVHLEPLANRSYDGGYDNSGFGPETEYAAGYSPPPMPAAARDPSPAASHGRAQTFMADELRPDLGRQDSYSRRVYARGDSPEGQPLQQTRPMI